MSFEITINKNEAEFFEIIMDAFNSFAYILIGEDDGKYKFKIGGLLNTDEELITELQEELFEHLSNIHIEEII